MVIPQVFVLPWKNDSVWPMFLNTTVIMKWFLLGTGLAQFTANFAFTREKFNKIMGLRKAKVRNHWVKPVAKSELFTWLSSKPLLARRCMRSSIRAAGAPHCINSATPMLQR